MSLRKGKYPAPAYVTVKMLTMYSYSYPNYTFFFKKNCATYFPIGSSLANANAGELLFKFR